MQKYLVVLDLEKLRAHLSKADGASYTFEDVRRWLKDAGFAEQGDGWVVSESDLGQVDPSEVIRITPVAR